MIVSADAAIQKLLADQVVAVPTETVYGLAGIMRSEKAIRKIFEVKERPLFDPLIVHVLDLDSASDLIISVPPVMRDLADQFWPGPLTLIFEKTTAVSDLITAGLPRVALRSPRHVTARQILSAIGAFAAPSANKFTKISPTTAAHVISEFGESVDVIDGGPCEVGLESTVVSCDERHLNILRPGRILAADLETVAHKHGLKIIASTSKAAPGQFEQHYQPAVPLVLVKTSLPENSVRQMVMERFGQSNLRYLQFPSSTTESARLLYSELRKLSADPSAILVAEPARWNWSGDVSDLMDRLTRAATLII